MKTEISYPLYQSISFWICVALFLYFTGNFFYLLFVDSTRDKVVIKQLRIIYTIVTISKDILLCLALFAIERKEDNNNEFRIPEEIDLDSFSPNHNLN